MTTRTSDPYRSASAARWKIVDASRLGDDTTLECDVAIIGSGAGGGVAAETLARAGLRVVIVEEGLLATSSDFRMLESDAYPELYQESAARKTADKAINILQGRCVGGGTTVNWTSSFRTPDATLAHWRSVHGIEGFAKADLSPWFERMEARLAIAPWAIAPNANNAALARGAAKLGIASGIIRRNVKACADLGYCGVGCPLDAKQSMLVTTIPAALERGATLVTRARAERLIVVNDRVDSLQCRGMDASGTTPALRRINVRARAFCSAAGAIGTPGLFLRSELPDPHGLVGRRTFLHPTIVSAALMPEPVNGFAGAPQTVYSDHYLDTLAPTGPIGFKLEAPPVHPILAAITLPGHGETHASFMRQFANLHVLIALLRDGFHDESPGGSVRLRDDGTPILDYPLTRYVWEGARRAFRAMAELQFAAGAAKVMPIHAAGSAFDSADAVHRAIDGFALAPLQTPVVSAHLMGGSPLGPDARHAVVDTSGRHHQLTNLYVIDGSLFPTSIGANPQLSIYAVAAKLSTSLAVVLGGRAPARLVSLL